jgi:hypothetical protein
VVRRRRRYTATLQQQVDNLNGKKANANKGARTELDVARDQLHKLKAENAALRGAAQENIDELSRHRDEGLRERERAKTAQSRTCAVQ